MYVHLHYTYVKLAHLWNLLWGWCNHKELKEGE